jgi:hypothetical protein
MFSITVKIDGIENRRRSSGLLQMVVGFFLIIKGSDYYQLLGYNDFYRVIPMLLVGSFSIFYGFFKKRVDPTYQYNFWLRLLQAICFTVLGFMMLGVGRNIDYIGVFIFAFLCILLLFSERRIFQETTIFIDEKGVRIPGYYRDHLITWQDLSEVVVREDFVTFFHRKDKYLQYQVMQDLSTLEVAKMNAFCREQIENSTVSNGSKINR